ncbi:MAG: hypothetical protein KatS3mg007_1750 [Thermoanaerobaculum sp.]|nr:MAG: hypothetical protein KatS3mg007_1750 [Thermoanaerobaculum sp.]
MISATVRQMIKANPNETLAIGIYDDQDRLLQYGDLSFTYTANGELISKCQASACQTFDYDVFGNLRHVILDNGMHIEYIIDGRNRRIGKKINGTLVQGFVFDDQLRIVAELDGSNQVVSRFIYADHINVPEVIEKGGRTYRILHDHLGSPRFVIDTQTGELVQEMQYDAWGNVVFDSNPGFQPFGFAGGLYDTHTKLIRFGARDYDPPAGRWTAKDPLGFTGGDTNFYAYTKAGPTNFTDAAGLFRVDKSCNEFGAEVGAGIKAACKYAEDPKCRRLLQVWGVLPCMEDSCRDGQGPCIVCKRGGSPNCAETRRPLFGCSPKIVLYFRDDGSCPRNQGKGLGPTIFHEMLHACGIGRTVPGEENQHPGPFRAVVKRCTNYDEPLPWWGQ